MNKILLTLITIYCLITRYVFEIGTIVISFFLAWQLGVGALLFWAVWQGLSLVLINESNKLKEKEIDISQLYGNKKKLLEICYYGILHAEDNLIDKAVYKNLNVDETADVPQSIQKIEFDNSSIFTGLKVNGQECSDDSKA